MLVQPQWDRRLNRVVHNLDDFHNHLTVVEKPGIFKIPGFYALRLSIRGHRRPRRKKQTAHSAG